MDGFKKLLQNRKTSALKVLEVWRTTCDADYSKNFPEFSTFTSFFSLFPLLFSLLTPPPNKTLPPSPTKSNRKMRSLLSSHQFSAEKLFFELSDPRTVAQVAFYAYDFFNCFDCLLICFLFFSFFCLFSEHYFSLF